MLDGFPRQDHRRRLATLTGDGESSPAFADLDGDNRNELIFARRDGFVHALRPQTATELPGWPVRGDAAGLRSHTGGRAYTSGEVADRTSAARCSPRSRSATPTATGSPRSTPPTIEGKVYGWGADGQRFFDARGELDFSGKPLAPFVERRARARPTAPSTGSSARRCSPTSTATTAHEIVAAGDGPPRLRLEPRTAPPVPGYPGPGRRHEPRSPRSTPTTHRVAFDADGRLRAAGRDRRHARGRRPRRRRRRHRPRRAARDRRRHQRGVHAPTPTAASTPTRVNAGAFPLLEQARVPLDPGNTRLYALNAAGDPNPNADPSRRLPGRLAGRRSGSRSPACCRSSARASPARRSSARSTAPRRRLRPEGRGHPQQRASRYVLNPNGSSCYGQDSGKDRDHAGATSAARRSQVRHPDPGGGRPARPSATSAPASARRSSPGRRRDPGARPRRATSTRAARTSSWPGTRRPVSRGPASRRR